MEWVYTTMSDPRALPTRLLGMVAPAVDKAGVVRTQIYPETPAPAAARLYAERRDWYYPSLPDEPRTTTFAEILETATAQTARCLEAIAAVADGDAAVDEAVAVDRRPQHVHRPGLRRPAPAGRLRARPRPHLGGRRSGLRPALVSASS